MPAASLSTGRVGRRGRNLAALLLLGALACLPTGALAARSASEQEKIGKNLCQSARPLLAARPRRLVRVAPPEPGQEVAATPALTTPPSPCPCPSCRHVLRHVLCAADGHPRQLVLVRVL